MRKRLLFGIAVLSVALGGLVFAQSEQAPTSTATATATVTGTVVSSSGNELVIDTATGRQRFVVESGTSIIPTNLASGTQVTVEFRTLDGDRRQAARVTASPRADATADTQSRPDDPTLPATASPLGLVGLLGLLSLGASAVVRAWRRSF
jgi:hypothetical protein